MKSLGRHDKRSLKVSQICTHKHTQYKYIHKHMHIQNKHIHTHTSARPVKLIHFPNSILGFSSYEILLLIMDHFNLFLEIKLLVSVQ